MGQIAIVILVLFSYPLQCHPCRASVRNINSWIVSQRSDTANYTEIEDNDAEDSSLQTGANHDTESNHWLITSLIIATSLLTAVRVKSLEVMLAFVGSTGSTSISFILPGLFAYKLMTLQKTEFINPTLHETYYGAKPLDGDRSFTFRDGVLRLTAIGLFFWGVIILVVCLGINIVHFA